MTESVTIDRVSGMPRLSDTLPSEHELAEQFGVSRTVIREAIRALAPRGVVDVQSGRGVRAIAKSARNELFVVLLDSIAGALLGVADSWISQRPTTATSA
jgi:DNA-binding FadR family transcriptional regulator